MATIGVLAYNSPTTMPLNNGLKVANRNINNNNTIKSNNNNVAVNKVNQNNNNNNNNNHIKITAKRELIVMKKKQKVLPLTDARTNIMVGNNVVSAPPTIATTAINRPTTMVTPSKPLKRLLNDGSANVVTTSGARTKGSPLPIAVARRNARERNRVKQVNNGFAALRERIPDEVAEAFEAQGNGRGSAKKLSKVETLRMAVEYIRSLERVLELDSSTGNGLGLTVNDSHFLNASSYQPSDTSSVISTLTPPPSDNISSGSFDEVDLLPDVTMLDGHQYIRIPGTNTYQLLANAIADDASILYENDENMEPIFDGAHAASALTIIHSGDNEYLGPMVDPTTIGYGQALMQQSHQQQHTAITTPIHILTPASISPGAFSGQSSVAGLSPAALTNDGNSIVTTANAAATTTAATMATTDPMLLSIKQELYHDGSQPLSEENMIEVMDWWHSQQQHASQPSDT